MYSEIGYVTLTTHGIVGGAIVALMPQHPIIGLCLAFASHFLLDAIPHWDYPIHSASVNPTIGARMRYDRDLLTDLVTIGADGALGVILGVILFATRESLVLVAGGACTAILPDALQFAYMRWPHQPLASLQRFHAWIHTSNGMKKMPIIGAASQVAFVIVFLAAARAVAAVI